MEMKAVKEYKEPVYPTKQESKNGIIEIIARSSKISLGLAFICVLCNTSFANSFVDFSEQRMMYGDLPVEYRTIIPQLTIIPLELTIIPLIITVITTMIFQIKYKKCDEEDKKLKLKKRRNITLCIGMVVTIVFVILSFIKI